MIFKSVKAGMLSETACFKGVLKMWQLDFTVYSEGQEMI